ncbi:hypothetical protein V3C99_019027 [Haemonchus contortus]|uniref:Reverse transcriptase domain-containing protein n=1 Tax=Haemonchus contortus TaxID=6289 RepID=A0A7I5EDL6_HAECO
MIKSRVIIAQPSKDQCEKKIGDVTGDGKLVERFFTIGGSSVNSQDGINTGKESNNDATETMEQMNAGIFELVEQMKQMKRSMASGPHYIGKRIDEANYRLNRRVASLEVQGKEGKRKMQVNRRWYRLLDGSPRSSRDFALPEVRKYDGNRSGNRAGTVQRRPTGAR